MKLFPTAKAFFLRLSMLNALIFFLPLARDWHWALDLGSNFQVQAFGVQLILILICAIRRLKKPLLISSLLLLPGIVHLWTWVGFQDQPISTGDPIKVTSFNVLYGGDGQELKEKRNSVISFLQNSESDLIFLTETDETWVRKMKDGLPTYPHAVPKKPESSCFSLILSKHPVLESEVIRPDETVFPILRAVVEMKGEKVTIIGVHPLPPMGPDSSERLVRYLAEVEKLTLTASGPVIVMGDLNVTPWSRHFAKLTKHTGLESAAKNGNALTTWNIFKTPWAPFSGLMIDHVLFSEELEKRSYQVTSGLGSDHFALTVEFGVK